MPILLKMTWLAMVEVLLAGIPESVGILVFGIGLVTVAILIRRALGRGDAERNDKAAKKA